MFYRLPGKEEAKAAIWRARYTGCITCSKGGFIRMAKPWDNGVKRLLTESPQDFLDWLLRGARFTGNRSREFESLAVDADAMQEVVIEGQRVLFHIEFQSTSSRVSSLLRRGILKRRRQSGNISSHTQTANGRRRIALSFSGNSVVGYSVRRYVG